MDGSSKVLLLAGDGRRPRPKMNAASASAGGPPSTRATELSIDVVIGPERATSDAAGYRLRSGDHAHGAASEEWHGPFQDGLHARH
jgi:hypothetical protein